MGLFLALSGVIGAGSNEVMDSLSDYAKSRSGGLEFCQGTPDSPNIGVVSQGGSNTTIFYPDGFIEWDEAASEISRMLSRPVFSLHIHDGDLWMFILYRNGEEIGRFNPIPDYWEELSADEMEEWRGDAALIAELVPGVSADDIKGYLTAWDDETDGVDKAYPDDEFPAGDCWQLCDFMKKIELEYPIDDDGKVLGKTFRFWTDKFRRSSHGEH